MDWSLVWLLWLGAILVTFMVLEGRAIRNGGVTLSSTIRGWCVTWPLLPFVVGLLFGVLGTHFFWPWCPESLCPPGGVP